jgi:hypothetical protein
MPIERGRAGRASTSPRESFPCADDLRDYLAGRARRAWSSRSVIGAAAFLDELA